MKAGRITIAGKGSNSKLHMEYLFFSIYLLVSTWLFPKISFVKHADLNERETRILLLIKMFSGLLCAIYFENSFQTGDHYINNVLGKEEYMLLVTNPKSFFTDFSSDIRTYGLGGLFETSNSFWGYLRFHLLHKLIAILNLATKGNFYFNSIIFSSIVFFGHIAFYRIYSSMYKGHKLKIILVCFFLPSVFLYTSCVHKDGLVFLSIGIISFILYSYLDKGITARLKFTLIFLLAIITIFLFRNYVLVALLPALLTALLCKILPYKKRIVLLLSYSLYAGLFFLSGFLTNSFNLLQAVINRKADFTLLEKGSTDITMNEMAPTLKSFVLNLPQAINHSLFRPYLWEFSSPGILLTALELFFFQLIVLAFIFFRNKKETISNNFNIYGFTFFITMIIIIGYIVPNVGAIVRYRSLVWIFILCPLVCCTDWNRLNFFKKHKPELF